MLTPEEFKKQMEERLKATTTTTPPATMPPTTIPKPTSPPTGSAFDNQMVDLAEVSQTKNTSWVSTLWKGIKQTAVTQYQKNIKPLKYLKRDDIISTLGEQADRAYTHPDMLYRAYGAGLYSGISGGAKGVSLGFVELPEWKGKYEEEIQAAKTNLVIGEIAGYGYSIGLAERGLTQLAVSNRNLLRLSPGAAKGLIRTTAFLGTSQSHKDLFSLTPAEKEAGETILNKRFKRLLFSAAALVAFRGTQKLAESLKLIKPQDPQLFFANAVNKQTFDILSQKAKAYGLDKHLESWATATNNASYVYNIGFGKQPIASVIYPKGASPDKWTIQLSTKVISPKLTGEALKGAVPMETNLLKVDNLLPNINPALPNDVITRAIVAKSLVQSLQNIPEESRTLASGIEQVSDAVINEAVKTDKVLDVLKAEYFTTSQGDIDLGLKPSLFYDDVFKDYVSKKYPTKFDNMAMVDNSSDLNLQGIYFTTELGSQYETVDVRQLILKHFGRIDLTKIPKNEIYKYSKKAVRAIHSLIQNYTIDGKKFDTEHQLVNYLTYTSDVLPKFEYHPIAEVTTSLSVYEEKFNQAAQAQGYKNAPDMIVKWEDEFTRAAQKDPSLAIERSISSSEGNPTSSDLIYLKQHEENAIEIAQIVNEQLAQLSREVAHPLDPALYTTGETANIITSLQTVEAGKRIKLGELGASEGEWTGYDSSFPRWITPELRTKELIDKVLVYFEKGVVPPAKNIREIRLYNEIKAQIEQANGVEISQPLGNSELPILQGEAMLSDIQLEAKAVGEPVKEIEISKGEGPLIPPDYTGQIYDKDFGWIDKFRAGLSKTYNNVNNIYDHLTANPSTIISNVSLRHYIENNFGKVIPDLYKINNLPRNAIASGSQKYLDILGAITKTEKDTFLKIVSNLDLYHLKLSGKTVAGNLSVEQIRANLKDNFNKMTVPVQSALGRYYEQIRATRQDLEGLGIQTSNWDLEMPIDQSQQLILDIEKWTGLENFDLRDLYFPHSVAKYNEHSGYPGIPKKLQKPFNQHLLRRLPEGTLETILVTEKGLINYFAGMDLFQTYHKEIDKLSQKYDILSQINKDDNPDVWESVKDYQKSGRIIDLSSIDIPAKVRDVIKSLNPKYDKLVFFPLQNFPRLYQTETLDEKSLTNILKEIIPDISENIDMELSAEAIEALYGKYAKTILAVGRKPMILVPLEIGQVFKDLKPTVSSFDKSLAKLSSEFFTKYWKPAVTIYGGGTNFQLRNGMGDFSQQIYSDPRSALYSGQAIKLLPDILNPESIEKYSKEMQHIYEILLESGIRESSFISSLDVFGTRRYAVNPVKWYGDTVAALSTRRELIPKLSSFLANVERVKNGKLPVLKGALPFIKSMVEEGLTTGDVDLVTAGIARYGNDVSVDYSLIPPFYRERFSQAWAPFGYWYGRTLDKTMRLLKDGSKPLLAMMATYVAFQIYNYTGDREEIERGLPPWTQDKYHLILGVDENGKRLVVQFPNPITDVFYRLFNVPAVVNGTLDMYKDVNRAKSDAEKEQIIKDGVVTIAKDFGLSPIKMVSSLLNPLVKIPIGILTNRDPYTGYSIVPDKYKDDPVETLAAWGKYTLVSLMSYIQYGEDALKEYDPEADFGLFMAKILKNAFNPSKVFTYKEYDNKLIQNFIDKGNSAKEARWQVIADNYVEAVAKGDNVKKEQIIDSFVTSVDAYAILAKVQSKISSRSGQIDFQIAILQSEIPKVHTEKEKDKIREQINNLNIVKRLINTSKIENISTMERGINPYKSFQSGWD